MPTEAETAAAPSTPATPSPAASTPDDEPTIGLTKPASVTTAASRSVEPVFVCPKCGVNRKSGKRSCCAFGGAWFEKCGDGSDPMFEHTWLEGFNTCTNKLTNSEATVIAATTIPVITAPASITAPSVTTTTTTLSIVAKTTCPKCGTNKKNGIRSCCAFGGAWFNKCGDGSDPRFEHTWFEGAKACTSIALSRLSEAKTHDLLHGDTTTVQPLDVLGERKADDQHFNVNADADAKSGTKVTDSQCQNEIMNIVTVCAIISHVVVTSL